MTSTVSLKTISAALKLIDSKRENLKKAFDDLQSHSSLLSSFSLTWSDLDSHFTSIQNSLTQQFHVLESLESQESQNTQKESNLEKPSSSIEPNFSNQVEPDVVATYPSPRPNLRRFCEEMDGKGLRDYIIEQRKDRDAIRIELPGALKVASDPAVLVLDAMEGFYDESLKSDGNKGPEFGIRRSCILLLETLMDNFANSGKHVRERAKMMAMEWKGKIHGDGEKGLEELGFLHLVAAYGLKSEFNVGELVDFFIVVAHYRQATKLCRVIDLGSNLADLVQRLINQNKQLLAVKFISDFKLTDKSPPVPLLKEYVKESEKLAEIIRKEGNYSLKSLNEATAKEVGALKSVIKILEEHNYESQYLVTLEKRVEHLEKQKADRKRPLLAKQQKTQHSGTKRPRLTAPVRSPAVLNTVSGVKSTVLPYQQTHLQSTGLLPDHHAPYDSWSAMPFGIAGSTATVPSYPGSAAAGFYGMAGGSMGGFSGNASTASSHLYPELYMPPGYYDESAGRGGYGIPPKYHPSYYPQS